MKHIKSLFFSLSAVLLLSGCSGSGSGTNNVANDPTDTYTSTEKVEIRQQMNPGGNITSVYLLIELPAGTTQSLLDYTGDVNISGYLEMIPPCVKGSQSFSCKAQLAGGTINAGQGACAIGQSVQLLTIYISRTPELRTTYGITGIQTSDIPPQCFLPTSGTP